MMKNPAYKTAPLILTLALALLAAGCGDLLKPTPLQVLILDAAPPDAPLCSTPLPAQIVVNMPDAHNGLNTDRIAILINQRELRHLPDYKWDAPAPLTVQRGLISGLRQSGCFTGAGSSADGLAASFRLLTDIKRLHFLQDEGFSYPAALETRLELTLLDAARGRVNGQKELRATRTLDEVETSALGSAMEESLRSLMREAAAWCLEAAKAAGRERD